MTASAYSSEFGLIASGDSSGHLHVHDFQRLSLVFVSNAPHEGEIKSICFHKTMPLLFASDSTGVIRIWQVFNLLSTLSYCLMRLIPSPAAAVLISPTTSGVASYVAMTSITVIEESGHYPSYIVGGDANGMIHCYSANTLSSLARIQGFEVHFSPCPIKAYVYNRTNYFSNLRLVRKSSVFHITSDDDASVYIDENSGSKPIPSKIAYGGNQPVDNSTVMNSNSYGISTATATVTATTATTAIANVSTSDTPPVTTDSVGTHHTQAAKYNETHHMKHNTRQRHDHIQQTKHNMIDNVVPTLSWSAHDSKIVKIGSIPYPGFLFSLSESGETKLWNVQGDCLGTLESKDEIKTKTKHRKMEWKYKSHSIADVNQTHIEVASKVLQKFLAEQNALPWSKPNTVASMDSNSETSPRASANKGSHSLDISDSSSSSVEEQVMLGQRSPQVLNILDELREKPVSRKAVYSSSGGQLSPSMKLIDELAQAEQAYSHQSIKSGVRAKLYLPEDVMKLENLLLRSPSHNELTNFSLPKVLLTNSEIKNIYHKDFIPENTIPIQNLPILRTCDNFTTEMRARLEYFEKQAIHYEPSEFLKLNNIGTSPSPTKRKVKQKLLKENTMKKKAGNMEMNSSYKIVLDRSVTLPNIQNPSSVPEEVHSEAESSDTHSPLLKFSGSKHRSLQCSMSVSVLEEGKRHSVSTIRTDEINDTLKANIERKLRLCSRLQSLPSNPSVMRKSSTERGDLLSNLKNSKLDAVQLIKSHKNPFGPHYSIKDVISFGDVLVQIDADLSGDINQSEWMKIMTVFHPKSSEEAENTLAIDLFDSVDIDHDGSISTKEILGIIFAKATAEQHRLMLQVLDGLMVKKAQIQS